MAPTTRLFKNGLIWQWDQDRDSLAQGKEDKKSEEWDGEAVHGWFLLCRQGGTFERVGIGEPPADVVAACDTAQIEDLQGRLVLPGLIDSHIHVGYLGECSEYIQLAGCASLEALSESVKAYSSRYPDKAWLVGVGWDQSSWERYPTRADLDQAEPMRPVVLYRACWHIIVVNTAALRRCGISVEHPSTPIPGGEIDVDEAGLPLGIFRENAVTAITSHISEADESIRRHYFKAALSKCLRGGLTMVQTNDTHAWGIYKDLQQKGELPIRVYLTINYEEMQENLKTGCGPKAGDHDGPLLHCQRVKMYADGSLGAETAALREPYIGTDNLGVLILPREELAHNMREAHKEGFGLEVHAIGDRALATVLEALEEAGVSRQDRPIITHCQVMGKDLIEKMADLGALSSIQPSFVGTDSAWVPKRIQKSDYAYCWKTLMLHGVRCLGGSDAPIEDCDPLVGIYDAIHRLPHSFKKDHAPAPTPDQVFMPHETLSFAQALYLYTVSASHGVREEGRLGRIKGGYLADFIVLDRADVVQSPQDLLRASVEQVWVDAVQRLGPGLEPAGRGGGGGGEVAMGGPYVPGKNGPLRGAGRALLEGKREKGGCCGR